MALCVSTIPIMDCRCQSYQTANVIISSAASVRVAGLRIHIETRRAATPVASSLSDLRLMDELRRGFFTPPVLVLVLVLVLLCGS